MSRILNPIYRCLLRMAILASVTGCSDRGPTEEFDFAQVSGTLRLNGQPMDQAKVEFVPDAGPSSVGYTDELGQYSLTTNNQTNQAQVPGAVVGNHRVLIRDLKGYPTTPEGKGAGAGIITGERRISDRYGDVLQTPLHEEVKTGAPQTIDLDVTGTS